MNVKSLQLLIVEDSVDDARLVVRHIERAGYAVCSERVDEAATLVSALAGQAWDIILCDYSIPGFSGTDALALVRSGGRDVPFIFVSGTMGEDTAVEAMKSGANDYVMKGNLKRLVPAIERELTEARIREQHRQAEQLLALRTRALEAAANAITIVRRDGLIQWVNPAFTELTGYSAEEVIGRNPRLLKSGRHEAAFYADMWKTLLAGKVWRGELINRRKDGSLYSEEQTITSVRDPHGEITHFISIKQDITERKRAEEELKFRNAILSTQQEASLDGILVVDENARVVSCNHRFAELWRLPPELAEARDAEAIWRFVTDQMEDSPACLQRVHELYNRRLENSREEIVLRDGRVFDRYSAPMFGSGDRYYGRVWSYRDITDSKQAEQSMRESEHKYRQVFESLSDAAFLVDIANRRIIDANKQAEVLLGLPRSEIIGTGFGATRQLEQLGTILDQFVASNGIGTLASYDAEVTRNNLPVIPVHTSLTAVTLYGRKLVLILVRDVTELKQLEGEFRQSQKMEAIGQLAGGVAHDFNNILAAILMQAELAELTGKLPDEIRDRLREIRAAAERAANLTRQLLLFSRRQVMQVRDLDLNEVVTSLVKMLQRIIGEDIRLHLNLHPKQLPTRADAGMLDQVLMNLTVNARDAMPAGGRLTIETAEKTVDETLARLNPVATPGRYVSLIVSDNGTGIPPEIMSRIFEPFFTTKEAGKGTGLGLATVFGIVKQHHGWIEVHSEPGQGTAFHVHLPASEITADAMAVATPRPKPRGGTETVLVTEDEPSVRILMRALLEHNGYHVLEAANGVEALQVWQEHHQDVALLLTDLVMPGGLTGLQVARQLQADNPQLKVVFTSGYSAEIAGREMDLRHGENFLQKPFPPDQLLETVRQCLDA